MCLQSSCFNPRVKTPSKITPCLPRWCLTRDRFHTSRPPRKFPAGVARPWARARSGNASLTCRRQFSPPAQRRPTISVGSASGIDGISHKCSTSSVTSEAIELITISKRHSYPTTLISVLCRCLRSVPVVKCPSLSCAYYHAHFVEPKVNRTLFITFTLLYSISHNNISLCHSLSSWPVLMYLICRVNIL